MRTNFHVGQKVVCIDDHRLPGEPGPYVKRNTIYTIRAITDEGVCVTLRFFELRDNPTPGWCIGYHPDAFRPIIERKTDISVFEEMLSPNSNLSVNVPSVNS